MRNVLFAAKGIDMKRTFYVEGGKEPLAFKLLFPFWVESESAEASAASKEELVTIDDKLKEISSLHYPVDVLKKRPLPADVDPLRIEDYLSDSDFEQLFKMDRAKFEQLAQWRKTEMKKKVDLF